MQKFKQQHTATDFWRQYTILERYTILGLSRIVYCPTPWPCVRIFLQNHKNSIEKWEEDLLVATDTVRTNLTSNLDSVVVYPTLRFVSMRSVERRYVNDRRKNVERRRRKRDTPANKHTYTYNNNQITGKCR